MSLLMTPKLFAHPERAWETLEASQPSVLSVLVGHTLPLALVPAVAGYIGTVHMAIVDPGVGTERDIILAEVDGHIFIAPDNGLLGPLLDPIESPSVFKLDAGKTRSLHLKTPSATFHGRDIFAPVAAELAAGRTAVNDIGVPVTDWTPGWIDEPESMPGNVSGVIVTIDAFGNLISNIDAGLLESLQEPVANIGGHQIPMLSTYGRAQPGDLLALVNSFGVVEVAKAEGSAAEGLGAARGAPLVIGEGFRT